MNKTRILRLVLLVILATLLAAGCAKKPAPTMQQEEAPVVTEMPEQEVSGVQEQEMTEAEIRERERMAREQAAMQELQRIFFDFDQYVLTPEAREILDSNAAYLKSNPGVNVRIEGHTDERGSDEYNLALGERRAQAAQKYLVSLGIDPGRLDVISYGEEKPLDPGNNEEAWAKNRRAEFVVVQ